MKLTVQVQSSQQPVPANEPRHRFRRATVRIDAKPGLGRRVAMQVLMGPNLVVPEPELAQQAIEFPSFPCLQSVELLFQGEKQPFNPAILPRFASRAERMAAVSYTHLTLPTKA